MSLPTRFLAAGLAGALGALSASSPSSALDPDRLRPPVSPTAQVGYLLTDDRLITIDPAAPGTAIADRALSGIPAGETVVGMDLRPATGALYVLTQQETTGRLYVLDPATGVATSASTLSVPLTGTSFGVDFNPVPDRLRVVSDADINLRINVDTGAVTTDTALAYAAGDSGFAMDPTITSAGYTNPIGGAKVTSLFAIDSSRDVLALQSPPNDGVLTTRGALGVDVTGVNGFDVTTGEVGLLVGSVGDAAPSLSTVNLATGAATAVGDLPGTAAVIGFTLSQPGYRIAGAGPVVGLTSDGNLVQLDGPGHALASATTQIQGLEAGDQIVGVDFRPANGELYGLGKLSNLYVIDVATGVANRIGSAPFTPALAGASFGFDFNPTVDRIRVTSDTGQNLRLNPNTGTVAFVDGAETFAPGDPNAGPGTATGAAYTNSVAAAASTQLFIIDSARSVLALQNPPNAGTLTTVGPLGVTVGSPNVSFDIVPGTNTALAVFETVTGATPNQTDALYTVDLANGSARLVGRLPFDVIGIAVPGDGPTGRGYHLASGDGGVRGFGDALLAGSAAGTSLNSPVVGIASRPVGTGYWLAAADGGVFSYGNASFKGSAAGVPLNSPVRGIVAHPSGDGYWLVAADGGVFSFGTASFFGSAGALPLQAPVVGMSATPTGRGYWLFAADGGVFSFGDARFFGSAGGSPLNQPIVGGAAAPNGTGYYLVARDGGVFTYGSGAAFVGSATPLRLSKPVVGIDVDPDGSGYWLAASDGGVFTFDSHFAGSAGGAPTPQPVVAIAAR